MSPTMPWTRFAASHDPTIRRAWTLPPSDEPSGGRRARHHDCWAGGKAGATGTAGPPPSGCAADAVQMPQSPQPDESGGGGDGVSASHPGDSGAANADISRLQRRHLKRFGPPSGDCARLSTGSLVPASSAKPRSTAHDRSGAREPRVLRGWFETARVGPGGDGPAQRMTRP